jgi:PadR family transcriptional regulator PadR
MIFKNGIEAMILAALRDHKLHGYAIAKRIREDSHGVLKFGEGQLYPALHKLEEAGMLNAEWEPQEGKPPRKVYAITPDGQAALESHTSQWMKFSEGVGRVLTGTKEVAHV